MKEGNVFRSKEVFHMHYFNNIVSKPTDYFSTMDYKVGTVVSRKLGESLFTFFNTSRDPEVDIKTKSLTHREYCGMLYLAGYVMQKLYLKHRNAKTYKSQENQEAMALLLASKSSVEYCSQENVQLINALS